jgi:hypothetical protein
MSYTRTRACAVATSAIVFRCGSSRRTRSKYARTVGDRRGAAGHLPGLAEDADRDALVVDIKPDMEHGCLLKSHYVGNAATGSTLPD